MHSRRSAIMTLSGGLLGQPRPDPGPGAVLLQATPVNVVAYDDAGGTAAGALTPQGVEDLSDTLTIVLCSLERLAREPLTQAAQHQLAQASAATCRSGEILWQAGGARSLVPVASSYQPFRLEQGP